ncbi:hypothetical protein AB3S75_006465 [Citrus x aurantiifolia]
MAFTYISAGLLILALLLTQGSILVKAKVPAVIVFGDSSVDTGNNNVIATVLKSNFHPYGRDFEGGRPTGRFCNGRVPPDFISEAFGLKPTIPAYLDPAYNISDFASGVCFASAGTGYDIVTSSVLNVIPLLKELEYFQDYQNKLRAYVGEAKAKEVITEALYIVSLGTNDFLENYYIFPQRRAHLSPTQFQDFLIGLAENFLRKLYNLGARKFSLTGLPPMGCLPLERTTNFPGHHDCVEEYNNVALEFNGKLSSLAIRLNRELPGIRILDAEAFKIFDQIIRKPDAYGFEVVEKACCATGTYEMSYLCSQRSPFTCEDASKYVFWDAFHPTEKTNKIISDYVTPLLLANFA